MSRRSVLSATERDSLLALPDTQDELIRHYTFNESDWALIRQRRGDANRLGFAVQLCLLRYPGYALAPDGAIAEPVIQWIASQIKSDPSAWRKYGERDETRREHFQELRGYLGLSAFGLSDFRILVKTLAELAIQIDKGVVLAAHALVALRQRKVILPTINVVERACAEAITRANRGIYRALTQPLTAQHRQRLDELLKIKPASNMTWLVWLRQSPLKPNSRYMLEHIERLKTFQAIALPDGIGRHIHQNRLLKIAREGGQMTPQDLGKFESERRYATLVALTLESTATLIDEIIDLHDRILLKLFSAAKHKHQHQFQQQGKAINDKVRLLSKIGHALLDAKQSDSNPYAAIESVISWDDILRFIATIQLKITSASQLFRRLNSYSKQHSLYQALKEFGKITKSLFILKYYDDCAFRQSIETQLNKIESSNKFSKAVSFGHSNEFLQSEKEEQEIAETCRRLIKNAIICWNYLYLSRELAAEKNEERKAKLLEAIENGSVMTWAHFNLHGEFDFSDEKMQDSVGLLSPKKSSSKTP